MEKVKRPYFAPEVRSEEVRVGVFGQYNGTDGKKPCNKKRRRIRRWFGSF